MTAAWWVINAAAIGAVFGVGYIAGNRDTPPVTELVYIETPTGDFDDVPMVMASSGGNTFRFLCDLHLDGTDDRAECEYREG